MKGLLQRQCVHPNEMLEALLGPKLATAGGSKRLCPVGFPLLLKRHFAV